MRFQEQNTGEKDDPNYDPLDKEVRNDTKVTCMQPIKAPIRKLDIYNCWASSRLDRLWRFDWWSTHNGSPPH